MYVIAENRLGVYCSHLLWTMSKAFQVTLKSAEKLSRSTAIWQWVPDMNYWPATSYDSSVNQAERSTDWAVGTNRCLFLTLHNWNTHQHTTPISDDATLHTELFTRLTEAIQAPEIWCKFMQGSGTEKNLLRNVHNKHGWQQIWQTMPAKNTADQTNLTILFTSMQVSYAKYSYYYYCHYYHFG